MKHTQMQEVVLAPNQDTWLDLKVHENLHVVAQHE